jgi:hypothetical protein
MRETYELANAVLGVDTTTKLSTIPGTLLEGIKQLAVMVGTAVALSEGGVRGSDAEQVRNKYFDPPADQMADHLVDSRFGIRMSAAQMEALGRAYETGNAAAVAEITGGRILDGTGLAAILLAPALKGVKIASPVAPKNLNNVNFAGHGSYISGSGTTLIPEGTSLTLFSKFGGMITDDLGLFIERGGNPTMLYNRIYVAGDRIPNYTLTPPNGLRVERSSVTVSSPTLLSDLLEPNMGACYWAACTYNRHAPNSAKAFGKYGVYDLETDKWLTIYPKD